MDYNKNVQYCEDSDFDGNGKLVTPGLDKSSVFILIQSSNCGHCKDLKPVWQKIANDKDVKKSAVMCCISVDDDKDLVDRITKGEFPFELEGFPTIVYYQNRKFVEEYEDSRSESALKKYILENSD